MNGNLFGNKSGHSRQAFRAHNRPFPFSSGQPNKELCELNKSDFIGTYGSKVLQ